VGFLQAYGCGAARGEQKAYVLSLKVHHGRKRNFMKLLE